MTLERSYNLFCFRQKHSVFEKAQVLACLLLRFDEFHVQREGFCLKSQALLILTFHSKPFGPSWSGSDVACLVGFPATPPRAGSMLPMYPVYVGTGPVAFATTGPASCYTVTASRLLVTTWNTGVLRYHVKSRARAAASLPHPSQKFEQHAFGSPRNVCSQILYSTLLNKGVCSKACKLSFPMLPSCSKQQHAKHTIVLPTSKYPK